MNWLRKQLTTTQYAERIGVDPNCIRGRLASGRHGKGAAKQAAKSSLRFSTPRVLDGGSLGANSNKEREANYFARCLLMPRKFLIADLKALGGVDLCEDDQVKILSKKYRVSISLMALRIYEVSNGSN